MLNPYNREHRRLIALGYTSLPDDEVDRMVKRVNDRFWAKRREAKKEKRRDNELNAALIKYKFEPRETRPVQINHVKRVKPNLTLSQKENILLNSKWGNLSWPEFWAKKRLLDQIDQHELYVKKFYSMSKQNQNIDEYYNKILYNRPYFPTKIKKLSFVQKWNYFNKDYNINKPYKNNFDNINNSDAEIMLTARHYTI